MSELEPARIRQVVYLVINSLESTTAAILASLSIYWAVTSSVSTSTIFDKI